MNEYPSANTETSQYNEAYFLTQRLHERWSKVYALMSAGYHRSAFWQLDIIRLDLEAAIKKLPNDQKYTKEEDTIRQQCLANLTNYSKLYPLIYKRSKLLKLIQDKSGLGAKWVDSEDDDLDE